MMQRIKTEQKGSNEEKQKVSASIFVIKQEKKKEETYSTKNYLFSFSISTDH